jgi:mono/diheme cytochrome c family protein
MSREPISSEGPDSPNGAHRAQSRERRDPEERTRPLPWFIVMLIGATTMWGVFYIHDMHIELDSPYGDSRTPGALEPPRPAPRDALATVSGRQAYATRCAPCHQATGAGVPGVFPPLAGSEWVKGSDRVLVLIPLHGINGPLTVRGGTYNGAMPSFNAVSDEEIAAILTYVRGQWGNDAPSVQAATVKAGREATKEQTTPWPGGEAIRSRAAP